MFPEPFQTGEFFSVYFYTSHAEDFFDGLPAKLKMKFVANVERFTKQGKADNQRLFKKMETAKHIYEFYVARPIRLLCFRSRSGDCYITHGFMKNNTKKKAVRAKLRAAARERTGFLEGET
jgi:phage-related protein